MREQGKCKAAAGRVAGNHDITCRSSALVQKIREHADSLLELSGELSLWCKGVGEK